MYFLYVLINTMFFLENYEMGHYIQWNFLYLKILMQGINVRSRLQSSLNNNIYIHAILVQYHAMNSEQVWLMVDT